MSTSEAEREPGALRALFGKKLSRDLEPVLNQINAVLQPTERVIRGVAGSWRHSRHCVVVLTSRQIVVAGGDVLQTYRFGPAIRDVRLKESWRRAELIIEGQGQVADVKGIHLDVARDMLSQIRTAVRVRSTTHDYPTGGSAP